MKVKRNKWKVKTVKAKTDLRYQIKEKNRIKLQRNQLKRELAQARQTIKKLQSKNQTLQVNDKVDLVFLVLQFFLIARIGFRAISRILVVISPYLGLSKTPCAQTVINWVNRLSIARIKNYLAPLDHQLDHPLFSGGVILVLDASIGLGKGKIMTVLALDIKHHLLNSGAPALENVQCVAVSVASSWTGETIADLLEKIIAVIGTPVAYLKDGGTDLGKSVRLLNERGLPSLSIDDVSHFIANLLKHEYQKHPQFELFTQTCGKASKMFKQTILACLAPPKVSTKARFMNIHRLVKWASQVLRHSSKGRAKKNSLLEKLRHGFDQLPQCKPFITDFLQDVEPLIACQKILKTKGMSQDSFNECQPIINTIPNDYIRTGFMNWLDKHLIIAVSMGLSEVGMPISSDCIESLFGVAKRHGSGQIKDANRIAQRIPSLCGKLTRQDAENVLKISVKEEQEVIGSMPSLIRERREVLTKGACLEKIALDDERQNLELIISSKTG
jgi:hypothetical protein